MPRPTKYTFSRIRRILKHLRKGGSKTAACGAANIDMKTMENWGRDKSGFSDAVKRALRRGEKRLVDGMLETAFDNKAPQHVTAKIFLLNSVHGYAKKSELSVKSETGGKSDSYQQFIKVLDKSGDQDREAFATIVERIEGNGGRGTGRIR